MYTYKQMAWPNNYGNNRHMNRGIITAIASLTLFKFEWWYNYWLHKDCGIDFNTQYRNLQQGTWGKFHWPYPLSSIQPISDRYTIMIIDQSTSLVIVECTVTSKSNNPMHWLLKLHFIFFHFVSFLHPAMIIVITSSVTMRVK